MQYTPTEWQDIFNEELELQLEQHDHEEVTESNLFWALTHAFNGIEDDLFSYGR